MLFLIIVFFPALGYITYNSGLNTYFHSGSTPSFDCRNSYQTSQTITFSGTFQNIPQVFIELNLVDITFGNTEYQLSITSVTLTNFQVKIFCPTSTRIYKLQFMWYAIDDQRVQVINAFNISNPTATTTYQHENANAQIGILFPISIHFVGALDFSLTISSITKTSVTVDISDPSGKFNNLLQIGYQIVLGTTEILNILGTQQVTTNSYQSNIEKQHLFLKKMVQIQNLKNISEDFKIIDYGFFPNLNLETNKWFLTPIIGLYYPDVYYIQFRWTYTTTGSTISYKVDSWDKLVQHTHQKVWMAYIINTVYNPLTCQTFRISQKIDLEAPNRPTVYAKLPQQNEIFDQIGSFTTIIDKSFQPVLIEAIIKCSSGKKIKSQFNKCNNCPNQKFYIQIAYYPRYITANLAHQELIISISSQRLFIQQVTYNQLKAVTTILDIEILNV